MKVNLGLWHRLTQCVTVLLIATVIGGAGFYYYPRIQQNLRMRKLIASLENEIAEQKRQSKQLEAAITALKTDPKAMERMAREKLGYSKPGETVIFFEDQNKLIPPQYIPSR